jgi:hypothetical protein
MLYNPEEHSPKQNCATIELVNFMDFFDHMLLIFNMLCFGDMISSYLQALFLKRRHYYIKNISILIKQRLKSNE